jgi:outer membrane protein
MPDRTQGVAFRFMLIGAALACSLTALAKDGAKPLTLASALKIAREGNEDFLISKEKLKQTKIMRDKAWAAFAPQVELYGTLTHSNKEIAFSGRMISKQDALAGKATATLTFLDASSITGLMEAYELAKAGVESTKYAMNELSFEVARAYYAVLSAGSLVEAAERSVATANEHLTAVAGRIDAGEALAIDEMRAKMELVSAEGDLVNAKNARDSTQDYLAFLLNMEPPLVLEPPPMPAVPEGTDEALAKKALGRRPDLIAQKHNVEAAKKAAAESWAGFFPTLGLMGTYNATQNTGFSGDPFSWNIQLFMQWVLWDGGLTAAAVSEKKSKLSEAQLEEDKLAHTVKLEVKQARRDLDNAGANVATAQKQLELARLSREMVMSRYNAGLATSLELTEADDDLRQAEVQLVVQDLSYQLCVLEVLRVIGLDPMGKDIPNP